MRLCFPRCTTDATCAAGAQLTCALHTDPVSDTLGYSCRRLAGGAGFGEPPDAQTGCKWRFSVGSGMNARCSHGCANDSDCAAPLPACKSTTFTTPSGGTAILKACVP